MAGGGFQRAGGGAPREISRPNSGGSLPNKVGTGGSVNRSQIASKVESRPKGSASALPSVAQGKRPSGAARGNKGNFPDLAQKTGGSGKLVGQGGEKLVGKVQGGQAGGQLAGKLQGGQAGSNLANRAQQGRSNGFLDKANASDWAKNRSPQWNQAVKNNQNYWNKWSANNQGKINDFRTNGEIAWNNNKNFWNNRNPSNTFSPAEPSVGSRST